MTTRPSPEPVGSEISHAEERVPENRIEHPGGRPPGLTDRLFPTRQRKRAEGGDALEALATDPEELPAPDRPVHAVTGAVPGHAQHRRVQRVLGHGRETWA